MTTPSRTGARWRPSLAAWAAVATMLGAVQVLARPGTRPDGLLPLGDHLRGWVQFDGPEYLAIATEGYQQRQLVWFPTYPLLVRGVERLTGDAVLAGVAVTLVAGAAALVLYRTWLDTVLTDAGSRTTAFAVLLLYPYGWFLYGAVYSDALFLALAVAAFLLVERDHLLAAGLVGAVATATRRSGAAVALGLAVLALERAGVLTAPPDGRGWSGALRLPTRLDRSRLRVPLAGVLVAWGGLVAYGTYLWVRWGNPVAFVTEQRRYHDDGPGTYLKQQFFEQWYDGADGRHLATTTAQAVLLVLALASVPAVGRRFGWGYAVLVGGLALLPAVSVATFMGVGRYLIPAFPAFALLGEGLSRRPVLRAAVLAAAGALLVVMTAGFSRSWYLT